MDEYMINEVRVIKAFPGFKEGDVLERYFQDFFVLVADKEDTVFPMKDRTVWRIDSDEVEVNMGIYFEDITESSIKSREDIVEALHKLSHAADRAEEDSEEKVVLENLVYCLGWVLGYKEYQFPKREYEEVHKEDTEKEQV